MKYKEYLRWMLKRFIWIKSQTQRNYWDYYIYKIFQKNKTVVFEEGNDRKWTHQQIKGVSRSRYMHFNIVTIIWTLLYFLHILIRFKSYLNKKSSFEDMKYQHLQVSCNVILIILIIPFETNINRKLSVGLVWLGEKGMSA